MGHRAWFFRIEDAELWLRQNVRFQLEVVYEATFPILQQRNFTQRFILTLSEKLVHWIENFYDVYRADTA